MTTPIAPIGAIAPLSGLSGAAAIDPPGHAGAVTSPATGAGAATGVDFGTALADGLDAVASAQHDADQLAVRAAAGELVDPAQYTIAATKAQLMTQLATTVQSKAVAAFNTVMAMQA